MPTATEMARPVFLLDTNVLLAALIAPERLADEALAGPLCRMGSGLAW